VSEECGGRRGFTLMELLLAVVIFGFIVLTVYGVLSRSIHARTVGEERAELYSLGRETVLKIADDLEGALLPLSGDRIHFTGTAQPPSVVFIRMNRGGYGQGRVRPGLVLVEYNLVPPDARGYSVLVRSEYDFNHLRALAGGPTYQDDDTRFDLDEENDIEAPTEQMLALLECPPGAEASGIPGSCARVAAMRFRFYDDALGDWREYWDSFEVESALSHRIPAAVEIVLVMLDEERREHEFYTVVDLPMARANPTPGTDDDGGDDEEDPNAT
jgi:prepilin-type N-terminal cleavage/methylation domain-containing protein